MQSITKQRPLAVQLVAGAVLLIFGLAPTQADASDVVVVARLDNPSHERPFIVLYSGDMLEDGTIEGTFMFGWERDIWGTFEGWVEDGKLVLDFAFIVLSDGATLPFERVTVDLETEYAVAPTGDPQVILSGTARVHIGD